MTDLDNMLEMLEKAEIDFVEQEDGLYLNSGVYILFDENGNLISIKPNKIAHIDEEENALDFDEVMGDFYSNDWGDN